MRWGLAAWTIIATMALMNTGFFMLFPLLALHMTRSLGFETWLAGLVLAVRQLSQQGLAPFGGALADRVGYKRVMVVGFASRVAGFAWYAFATDLSGVLIASVLSGFGGSLFEAPARAAVGSLVPEKERPSAYAAVGTALALGQVLGPLVGSLLLPFSFMVVSLAAAGTFLVATVLNAAVVPGWLRGESGSVSVLRSIQATVRDRDFAWFTLVLVGHYYLVVQMIITIPLLTTRVVGPEMIWVPFAVQAGTAVLVQIPVANWASRRFGPFSQMTAGMLLTALGFGFFGWAGNLALIVFATFLTALGNVLVVPSMSTVTVRLAGGSGGAYFGVGALALGLGGALGNGSGGWLLDQGARLDAHWLPWVCMAAIALASALGFYLLDQSPRLRARVAEHPRVA